MARLVGLEPPKWPDDEASIDALHARIRKTIDYALLRQGGVELGKLDFLGGP